MSDPATPATEAREFLYSTRRPSPAQSTLALLTVAIAMVGVALAWPLAATQFPPSNVVVPGYAAAIMTSNLVTAFLLFAQFTVQRSRTLLVLGSAYLYAGLAVVVWTMTFPGVFSPSGLLGAGIQTTEWIFVCWRAGFALLVAAYALMRGSDPGRGLWYGSTPRAIAASASGVVALLVAVTLLATVGHERLPRISIDAIRFAPLYAWIMRTLSLLVGGTVVLLWRRRSSVLDLWLTVALTLILLEFGLLSVSTQARFNGAWYAGRILNVASAVILVLVQLHETAVLFAQMMRVSLAQRRERTSRTLTGDLVSETFAQRVGHPLHEMRGRAEEALRNLEAEAPDLRKVEVLLEGIVDDGRRVGETIESVRARFRQEAGTRRYVDWADLAADSHAAVRADAQALGVTFQVSMDEGLPRVKGDPLQLQQVLMTMMMSAVESACAVSRAARVLRVDVRRFGASEVVFSVEAPGAAFGAGDFGSLFGAASAVRSRGMGMSMARSIAKAHEGTLSAASSDSDGALLRLVMPGEGP